MPRHDDTRPREGALPAWGVPDLYSAVIGWAEDCPMAFGTSEVERLAAILTVAREATRLVLGVPTTDDGRTEVALTALGLDAGSIDSIAGGLATHVADLAATMDVTLGEIPDYQALLDQAREQIVSTSIQIAEESVARTQKIATLEAAHDSLRHDARTDRLTGLPNRASFDDAMQAVVADRIEGRTRSGALGVTMIDIDHFKLLNDTYGHRCGDAVLAAVGRTLARMTRSDEMIARYGGEEFVLIAPIVADLDALASVAERVRASIAEVTVEFESHVLNVTVSVGAVGCARVVSPGAARELVGAADELLYQAKHAGRNTCCVALCDVL